MTPTHGGIHTVSVAALGLLIVAGCSDDDVLAPPVPPALQTISETPSSVSRPVLRATLPASWDENWFASPAVYDLDNDGHNEVIASRHSVLYVWSDSGTLLWRAPVGQNASTGADHGSSRMYCSPAVGDLDNDGIGRDRHRLQSQCRRVRAQWQPEGRMAAELSGQ